MFSSLKFRDVFTEVKSGLPPNSYGTGSVSGSPINMTGARKAVFHVNVGSGPANGVVQLFLYAASVSAGTGATSLTPNSFGPNSSTMSFLTSLTSASNAVGVYELRGEFLENNSVGPWIFPLLSVAGGTSFASVVAHTFLRNYEPGTIGDSGVGYVLGEQDYF